MGFTFNDLNNDTLVEEKIVKLNIDGYDSVHKVSKYKVKSGAFENKAYFIFDYIDGKAVMNYGMKNYELLYNQVKIDLDEPIYQMSSTMNAYDLIKISFRYRVK